MEWDLLGFCHDIRDVVHCGKMGLLRYHSQRQPQPCAQAISCQAKEAWADKVTDGCRAGMQSLP